MQQRRPSIELGPYQLAERIGEGGNGQVYRATGPDGLVAVKLLAPATELDDAARARFGREITALAALSHPNLVALVDHGVDPELGPYLVLPLLAGANLRELGRAAMCPEAALLLIQPIVDAAVALHDRGYVHRDLKPENAIASPDGTVVVIDLGLAWGETMTRHTESGAAVGSIGYMAPEQLEGRAVDARADVWALGVMIYEWITGKRPFARGRPTEEVAAALLGTCARLTAADRRASDELAELVARCLATDPANRPSAGELARAIAAMIDWAPPEQLAAERAAVVADPAGYQARVAPFRIRRLERLAREAIDAGKPFAALTHCDRGLAYAPDHAPLVELVARAEAATAQPALATAPTEMIAAAPATVPTAPARRPAGHYLAFAAIGAGLIGGAVAITLAIVRSRDRAAPPVSPTAQIETKDRELVHDVISMFGKAIDRTRAAPAPAATVERATTATGWLQLAETQPPAQAVASIRQALVLNPGWAAAEDRLCTALVAAEDDGALTVCDASVRRKPDDVSLRAARAAALLHGGQAAAAVADLDRVIASDPAPRWRRLRAQARAAAGDPDGARRDLEQACQLGDADACRVR